MMTATDMTASGSSNHHKRGGDTRARTSLEIAADDDQRIEDCYESEQRTKPSTIEERYHAEREEAKLRHWKDSDYAAGLVEPSWADELDCYRRGGGRYCPSQEAVSQIFQDETDPGCGCVYMSALVCSRLGAGRIGNMIVLKERYVLVEEEDEDDNKDDDKEEEGQDKVDGFMDEEEALSSSVKNTKRTRVVRRRELQLVVGPFWPMLLFITYPLIFAVSGWTLYKGVPGKPLYAQLGWALMTGQLIRSLFNTGFRDPGILTKHHNPPAIETNGGVEGGEDRSQRRVRFRRGREARSWRWSDRAQTYHPGNSRFCPDCQVVIEDFDHTCPWMGTAIGKNNMGSFQRFLGLVFACLILDFFLLTADSLG